MSSSGLRPPLSDPWRAAAVRAGQEAIMHLSSAESAPGAAVLVDVFLLGGIGAHDAWIPAQRFADHAVGEGEWPQQGCVRGAPATVSSRQVPVEAF